MASPLITITEERYAEIKDSADIKLRKDAVLQFMQNGLDFRTACTAAEAEHLEEHFLADEEFANEMRYTVAKTEAELLARLTIIAQTQANMGNSKATERLLELLRPERYQKSTKVAHTLAGESGSNGAPSAIKIDFVASPKKPEMYKDYVNGQSTAQEEDEEEEGPSFPKQEGVVFEENGSARPANPEDYADDNTDFDEDGDL